jgi:hypothetical protein
MKDFKNTVELGLFVSTYESTLSWGPELLKILFLNNLLALRRGGPANTIMVLFLIFTTQNFVLR